MASNEHVLCILKTLQNFQPKNLVIFLTLMIEKKKRNQNKRELGMEK